MTKPKKRYTNDDITLDYILKNFKYDKATGDFIGIFNPDASNRRNSFVAGRKVGSKRNDGYIILSTNGRRYYAHRLAWLYEYGSMPDGYIDHINGNPSDNRIENLRLVNHKINIENQIRPSKNNKSGYLGVYKIKRCGMYTATVYSDGRRYMMGRFVTAEEAHEAYVKKKREIHGGCTI